MVGLFRSPASLAAEILILRHQINILRRHSPRRQTFSATDRLIFAGLYRWSAGDPLVASGIFRTSPHRAPVGWCGITGFGGNGGAEIGGRGATTPFGGNGAREARGGATTGFVGTARPPSWFVCLCGPPMLLWAAAGPVNKARAATAAAKSFKPMLRSLVAPPRCRRRGSAAGRLYRDRYLGASGTRWSQTLD